MEHLARASFSLSAAQQQRIRDAAHANLNPFLRIHCPCSFCSSHGVPIETRPYRIDPRILICPHREKRPRASDSGTPPLRGTSSGSMTSTTSALPVTGRAQPSQSPASQPAKRRHESSASLEPPPNLPVASAIPDSKRARQGTFHTSPHLTPPPPQPVPSYMSAKVQGKRPEVIDLSSDNPGTNLHHPHGAFATRRPALQPHMGPRKLVIKNLRPATPDRAAVVNNYYSRTHAELDDALTAIFAGRQTVQPMERLYRGVEDICRKGESQQLADSLRARCEAYVAGEGGPAAAMAEADDVVLLARVLERWRDWSAKLLIIRWIFSYLDRSWLLLGKGKKKDKEKGINDLGISLFRQHLFGGAAALGERVGRAMCRLVEYDRRGNDRFNSVLLKESVTMVKLFGSYAKFFDTQFVDESRAYFAEFGEEKSASLGLKDYVLASQQLLQQEVDRCNVYHFDSITKRALRNDGHDRLIRRYSEKLLDSGNVARLLEADDVRSIKALYELLRLSKIEAQLKGPWEEYIRKAGTAIIGDTSRGDEMVIRLLELRKSLDIMIRDAFSKDDVFVYGLRESFSSFINDQATLAVWKTGTSKVGELIAKYIDMLLRGGLKTLPAALLSDSKDRAEDERSGVAATGDEDAELDRQLDAAIELFRFVEGKDVFEAFYKKDLARRLLMGRSASQDAERNMLQKLKSECGSSFTHNLEQMFKDQELGKDEMAAFKEWLPVNEPNLKSRVDLHVSVLSNAAWPTYPEVRACLPRDVLEVITAFDTYYKQKHTGRRLTWRHNLSHAVVRGQFNRGPKELLVSCFQAVVLVLFNDADKAGAEGVLGFSEIAQATSIPEPELIRTLQSLACGKARVLNKHPKGRDVNLTDTFTVNKAFTDPKFRVKINQIQLRETKEENKETHKRVTADRQFETQAAIVRIMKARKTMTHAQLVAEVINQTKHRGAVDASDIKVNIEK